MAEDDGVSPWSQFDASTLVGLTVEEARSIATGMGCLFRVTPVGESVSIGFNMTTPNRVDVIVEEGLVVRAIRHGGEFGTFRRF